jgi:hypothetical protein
MIVVVCLVLLVLLLLLLLLFCPPPPHHHLKQQQLAPGSPPHLESASFLQSQALDQHAHPLHGAKGRDPPGLSAAGST